MENQTQLEKPRILCLHGSRSSGLVLKNEIQNRWPETVLEKLDLVFLNGAYPVQGKSGVEELYDPPYYEWFQANADFSEFTNFEECVAYIEDYMANNGPFDGFLGFSQGAVLTAALPGMQNEGVALTKIPKIKFVIIIAGGKFGGPDLGTPKLATNAFSSPIECPSLHFIGELDPHKEGGNVLMESFMNPVVIQYPEEHTIPGLDEKQVEIVLGFIENIQTLISLGT